LHGIFDILLLSFVDLRHFVARIGTVIIDEAHPLIYHYRGRQLAYLLTRLERRHNGSVQKIILSATLSDVDAAVQFFGLQAHAVRLITSVQRDILPHLVHLKNDDSELIALLNDLYETYEYRKILLFANSRGCCDRLFSILSHHGAFQGVTDLHYSNLKPKERRGVERRFRRREHALCIATSTLELGIDVGNVDGVLLYEPPDSVSAFLQRIGRSNRRESCAHFWGICKGSDAQAQLLRFLALLNLARQGKVETPQPKNLPSVLIQQILSCLYEKKRLSLPSLQDLFSEQKEITAHVFEAMIRQNWLQRDRVSGLVRGGRRYRDCFLERQIWSNFPETEEDYTLEFAGEAVANLPKSIVRQLELGDRLQLAGKRLQVLNIESGERKRVVAQSVDILDDKELFWLGAGLRVSYEVAQAVQDVLHENAQKNVSGIFSRTRKLLVDAQEMLKRRVILGNGIEVGRNLNGFYRYQTYLGSVGNLILQWAVENAYEGVEDLSVTSDGTGIDCSFWIDFQMLKLPIDRDGFAVWVGEHLKALYSLFPLTTFRPIVLRVQISKFVIGKHSTKRMFISYQI